MHKGKIVLFTFDTRLFNEDNGYSSRHGQEQTVPAIVTNVWSPDLINLTAFPDGDRGPINVTSVMKKNANPENGFYWEDIVV